MKSQLVLRRFLFTFLPLLTLVCGISMLFYYLEAKNAKEKRFIFETSEVKYLKLQMKTIISDFKMIKSDLAALISHHEMHKLLESGESHHKKVLAEEFLKFCEVKAIYDQVRLLDENGKEIVRVNYNSGNPYIVPEEQLQFKRDRYYFKDTFKMDEGEMFMSPFDLNMEGGKIEKPLKPMIRFGTTVLDHYGQKRGIVVLNYLGENLINDLKLVSEDAPGHIMLLNSDGYWLRGVKPENEWGFMYEGRKNVNFGNDFFNAWQQIAVGESGHFYNMHGLFTFMTVHPLQEGWKSTPGSDSSFRKSVKDLQAKEYSWKIVSHVTPDVLSARLSSFTITLFSICGAVIVLIGCGLWFIANTRILRMITEKRLASMSQILEESLNEIYIFDVKTLRFIQVNKGARLNLGYSTKELNSLTPLDLKPELTVELFAEIVEPLRKAEKQKIQFETVHRRKDGSLYNVEAHLQLSTFQSIPVFVAIILDITERKLAEKKLKESEAKLRSIVSSLYESAIMVCDQDGKVTSLWGTPEMDERFGIRAVDVPGKSIRAFVPPEQVEQRLAEISNVFDSGEKRVVEYKVIFPGGNFWFEVSLSPMRDANGNIVSVIGFVKDITKRKRDDEELKMLNETLEKCVAERTAELIKTNEELEIEIHERKRIEERLKDSLEQSRIWLDNSPICTKVVDLDFKLKYMSAAGIKALKIDDVTKFYGKPYPFDFFPESTKRGMKKNLKKVKETGEIISGEAPVADIYGNELWFRATLVPVRDYEGRIDFIIIVSVDINERKKMEEEQRESEEKYRGIYDESIVTIYLFDEKKHFIDSNQAGLNLLGYSKAELLGMSISDVDADPAVVLPAHQQLLSGNRIVNYEHRLRRKDGTIITVLNNSIPLTDADGKIVGMQSTLIDITDLKKMEAELVKMQRLESIGVLAGGIAHDFNNYLQGILSNIEIAKSYVDSNNKGYAVLSDSKRSILQAKDLTQQLLTFSKGGEPVKKTISVSKLIKDSAHFALSGTNIKCEFDIPDYQCLVEVDTGQMNQVFNNLFINANESMPESGIVKIWVERINHSLQELLPQQEERYVKITIKDQGIGIAQDKLQKIFDPYFTTKQDGNGLGLATVYSIIKKHSGHITVESEMGVGTTFYIYIPTSEKEIYEKPVPGKAESSRPELAKGNGEDITLLVGKKILFMDDDAIIKHAVVSQLKNLKYEVEGVNDGTEAIALYKKAIESGKPFDAVILDLTVTSGMGGREAIVELRNIDIDVKAIVASGYSNDPIMTNFDKYGFKGIVTKPYGIRELEKVLLKVIMEKEEP